MELDVKPGDPLCNLVGWTINTGVADDLAYEQSQDPERWDAQFREPLCHLRRRAYVNDAAKTNLAGRRGILPLRLQGSVTAGTLNLTAGDCIELDLDPARLFPELRWSSLCIGPQVRSKRWT